MDITKNDLITKILGGEFQEAKVLIHYFSKEKLKAILVDLAYDSENFIVYAFVFYLIQDKESVELHRVAFTLLSIAFFFFEGGYQSVECSIRTKNSTSGFCIVNQLQQKNSQCTFLLSCLRTLSSVLQSFTKRKNAQKKYSALSGAKKHQALLASISM